MVQKWLVESERLSEAGGLNYVIYESSIEKRRLQVLSQKNSSGLAVINVDLTQISLYTQKLTHSRLSNCRPPQVSNY
jgi:hypothetical protein